MPRRTPVYVYARDEITEEGIRVLLRRSTAIEVVAHDAIDTAAIAVVAAAGLDDDAIKVVRGIQRDGCPAILLILDELSADDLAEVGASGISGVLRRREVTAASLGDAVERVGNGLAVVPDDVVGVLLARAGRDDLGDDGGGHLDEREREVLRHLADGLSTAEIGQVLAYSERTVKGVVHDITTRLHLRNRAHAVAVALKSGWI